MSQNHKIRSLLLVTALAAGATTAAFAQTTVQPATGMMNTQAPQPQAAADADMQPAAPAAQGVTPAPRPLMAPGSADPFVQKRNADAQANAEYRASKKSAQKQYKEQVGNAKVNRQADKQTAAQELKGATPQAPVDEGTQH